MLVKAKSFVQEVREELHKVTWPTRKETIATTWVVVVIIVIISFYLGICDLLLNKIMRFVIQ